MKFVNLYYGRVKPLTSGVRQFDTEIEAKSHASDENYFGTVAFESKSAAKEILAFDVETYEELVEEDGSHVVKTKGGLSVRVTATDRQSNKGYNVTALVLDASGNPEHSYTYTNDGKFQIGEDSDKDLVIVEV